CARSGVYGNYGYFDYW
nr:immunoglobulin heavy chain junction region [Mus musculus]MBK4186460.1 immunoglobulin heavy chain junction region [Mus musculus]MBK4186461.1 immunoglobulin heavy chain junction region [Mus musculus]MBK4195120.1 immunoglobulin heavy chain junction region [Mus musculus]